MAEVPQRRALGAAAKQARRSMKQQLMIGSSLALALVASACTEKESRELRQAGSEAAGQVVNAAKDVKEEVKEALPPASEVRDEAAELGRKAEEALDEAGEKVRDGAHAVKREAQDLADDAR